MKLLLLLLLQNHSCLVLFNIIGGFIIISIVGVSLWIVSLARTSHTRVYVIVVHNLPSQIFVLDTTWWLYTFSTLQRLNLIFKRTNLSLETLNLVAHLHFYHFIALYDFFQHCHELLFLSLKSLLKHDFHTTLTRLNFFRGTETGRKMISFGWRSDSCPTLLAKIRSTLFHSR